MNLDDIATKMKADALADPGATTQVTLVRGLTLTLIVESDYFNLSLTRWNINPSPKEERRVMEAFDATGATTSTDKHGSWFITRIKWPVAQQDPLL